MRYVLTTLGICILLFILGLFAIFVVTRTELYPLNTGPEFAHFQAHTSSLEVVSSANRVYLNILPQ